MVISLNIGADSSILFDFLFLNFSYFIFYFFILRLITLFQALFLPFIMPPFPAVHDAKKPETVFSAIHLCEQSSSFGE